VTAGNNHRYRSAHDFLQQGVPAGNNHRCRSAQDACLVTQSVGAADMHDLE